MKKNTFKKALAWITCAAMITAGGAFSFAEAPSYTDEGQTPAEVNSPNTLAISPGLTSSPVNDTDLVSEPSKDQVIVVTNPKTTADFSKFKDAASHWAKADLKRAVEDGRLQGFNDNTLRPNSEITLAQMITIITRILKPEIIGDSGAPAGSWYKDAADKAIPLGLIIKRNAPLLNSAANRQSACAMIAEAFQLKTADPDKKYGAPYSDYPSLPAKDKLIFASLIEQGYLQGYNGSLMLANSITRAEFVTILYRIADAYLDGDDFAASSHTANTVVSTENFNFINSYAKGKIWTDATAKTVNIEDSSLKALTVRSDDLQSLTVNNSDIDRLCIAARSGAVNLDCTGIDTTVIGSGKGKAVLNPEGNSVEVTGDYRTVELNGPASKVAVSGDNNTIVINSGSDIKSLVINGTGNTITVDAAVGTLTMSGKANIVKGNGVADTLILYTGKSSIKISVGQTIDRIDKGIADMNVTLYGPGTIKFNEYFTVNTGLTGTVPEGTAVNYTWTMAGKVVKTGSVVLSTSKPPVLSYYYSFTGNVPDSISIGLKLEYTTTDGEYQVLEAKNITVKPDKNSEEYIKSLVNSVKTKYVGNRTTQWAIDHDYSRTVKEVFVNYKGYSSSSKYLIWVNIGTQHCMVFQGSKGHWSLLRSGLVSTGANDCTPRGTFKTTYKQTNWTTDTYTVKPIVRFYGGGYALHSRLYYPNTTNLKPGSGNGVGYPLSHGCVRMQADDITWIYNNVPNGTTVVVF